MFSSEAWSEALRVRAADLPLENLAFAAARVLPTTLLVPTFAALPGGRPLRIALALLLATALVPLVAENAAKPPVGGLLGLLLAALAGLPVALVARTVLLAASGPFSLGDGLAGFTTEGLGNGGPELTSSSNARGPFAELGTILAGYVYFASGSLGRTVSLLGAAEARLPSLHAFSRVPATLLAGIGLAATFAAPWLFARLFCDVLALLAARASGGASARLGDFGLRRLVALFVAAALLEHWMVRLASLLAG